MKINMNDSRLTNITQIRAFLKGSQKVDLSFEEVGIEGKYTFIDQTVDRLKYRHLSKKDKRVVLNYLTKVTGYKKAQLHRLVKRAKVGSLKRRSYQRTNSHKIYTGRDIKLLEKTDEYHQKLNALATKEIMRREVEVFDHREYQTISRISPSHVGNLRKSPTYRNTWVNHTKPSIVPIGLTKVPDNHGRPGSIRVDTVHQRNVYYINAVDEILQWEIVVCVPTISEQFLKPALEQIIDQCPFTILNFHSDRGSEYINYIVARLLNKLSIEQTKSRSRHPNDNALVETKNGSVIRKHMGWEHLDQGASDLINRFYQDYFNPYLNYHRPCLFYSKVVTNKKGRSRKIYDEATVPYEKLKEVDSKLKKTCLKPNVSFNSLDKIAYQQSDNQFAKIMQEEKRKLFNKINKLNWKAGSCLKSKS
jgi:transposase InsO family protein